MNWMWFGRSEGTVCFMFMLVIPIVSKFTISRIVRSSTNLNLSFTSTQSALLFDCDRYSSNPKVAPCGPPPLMILGTDLHPCHFTDIFLSWKYFTRRGMREGRTPFSMKDSIPSFGHCLGKALSQSTRFAMTANTSPFELLSNVDRILCNICIR